MLACNITSTDCSENQYFYIEYCSFALLLHLLPKHIVYNGDVSFHYTANGHFFAINVRKCNKNFDNYDIFF